MSVLWDMQGDIKQFMRRGHAAIGVLVAVHARIGARNQRTGVVLCCGSRRDATVSLCGRPTVSSGF